MSKTEFDVFCPVCNMLVAAKVVAEGNGGFRSDAVNPLDEIDTEYHGEHYYVCLCGRCSQPFLIRQSLYGIPAEFESVTDEKILYPSEKKLPLDGVPNTIKSAYDQAARSFSASLFEPCVLMCRKCLEATCKNLRAKGRDLNSKLQSLFDGGHIDSRLLNWAHEIRLIGNEAAHDPDTKVSKRDARDVLDFTEAILIYIFSLTSRFEAFRVRRANSQAKP
ncbi:hypothetical protein ANRL1_03917 [Anaerolineae bacterium]|nr:hypothetical protein ANRL1_03917 [Anaerolineae bacterium]